MPAGSEIARPVVRAAVEGAVRLAAPGHDRVARRDDHVERERPRQIFRGRVEDTARHAPGADHDVIILKEPAGSGGGTPPVRPEGPGARRGGTPRGRGVW